MKKTLASDPIFINALQQRYDEHLIDRMINYWVKKTTHYVRFENGMIYVFDKPSIKTEFCFGYGQNGVTAEDEHEAAYARCKAVKEKENFFKENLRYFEELENLFNQSMGDNIYAHRENDSLFTFLFGEYDATYGWFSHQKPTSYILTKKDKNALRRAIEIGKELFTKRLETYWKRFGSSKLHTRTYLID